MQFIPEYPLQYVIISINSMFKHDLLHITIFFVNKDFTDYSKQVSLHKIQSMIILIQIILYQDSIKEVAPEICAFASLFE